MTDYISREEALHALCEAVHSNDGCVPCRNQLVSCRWSGTRTQAYAERILAIPAADVRPVVHGKLIHETIDTHSSITGKVYLPPAICSICGSYFITDVNFCAYCGADLREEVPGHE